MKMQNNRVLIDPDQIKTTTSGGIVIPDKHADAPSSGIILSSSLPNFPKGIRIFYFTYASTKLRLNLNNIGEKEYHLVHEKDILFIVEESDGI